ncbi:MAG TPA: hypothetical protein VGW77_07680 [Candidatus Binatia bacterium]|nr:hypothetical protein [Candidatus Binatia bacterium]
MRFLTLICYTTQQRHGSVGARKFTFFTALSMSDFVDLIRNT